MTDLTRRDVLGVAATALVASALPQVAAAAPAVRLTDSPVLKVIDAAANPVAFKFQAAYLEPKPVEKPFDVARPFEIRDGAGNRLSFQVIRHPFGSGEKIGSIEEAEDRVLGVPATVINLREVTVQTFDSPHDETDIETYRLLVGVLINRHADIIMQRTRRAAGNHAFMHPVMADRLLTPAWRESANTVGRWRAAGKMNGFFHMFAGSHMPEDEIAIVFRGDYDPSNTGIVNGAAGVMINGDTLEFVGSEPGYIPPENYVARIKLLGMPTTVHA